LYRLPNIVSAIKSMKLRWVSKILTGKHIGKGPLGRLRRRWEGNIKMDLNLIT
jgi:hypothetical protein